MPAQFPHLIETAIVPRFFVHFCGNAQSATEGITQRYFAEWFERFSAPSPAHLEISFSSFESARTHIHKIDKIPNAEMSTHNLLWLSHCVMGWIFEFSFSFFPAFTVEALGRPLSKKRRISRAARAEHAPSIDVTGEYALLIKKNDRSTRVDVIADNASTCSLSSRRAEEKATEQRAKTPTHAFRCKICTFAERMV